MAFLSYEIVRVFTRNGENGNTLAVFPDSSGLSAGQMQSITKRLHFSETSFVFPPSAGADYRVRFFTPEKEISFAGHPSIGTLFTLIELGILKRKKKYIQQIGRRLIGLTLEKDGAIFMNQGRPFFGKTIEPTTAKKMLGLRKGDVMGTPTVVSTGLPHIIVPLSSFAALKNSRIRNKSYREIVGAVRAACVMPFTIYRGKVRCRMFAPALGVDEDPATGSGCGPLASYVVRKGLLSFPSGIAEMEVLQGVKPAGASLLIARIHLKGRVINRVEVGGFSRWIKKNSIR